MQEIMQTIWQYMLSALAGITVGGIVTTIASIIIRSIGLKAKRKLDALDENKLKETISQEASDKAIEHLKKITFKQNIAPLVKSELRKIHEEATKASAEAIETMNERLNAIVDCIASLGAYFDNSIGVPEEKKEMLRNAILLAKTEPTEAEIVMSEEVEEEVAEEPTNADKPPLTKIMR